MEDTEIAHLAGFVDSAGRITVHVAKNERYALDYELRPIIRIYIPETSEAMVGKIEAYCDDYGVKTTRTHKEASHSYCIHIRDRASIRRFLEPMMDWLVIQYEAAIIMLDEILPAFEEGKHTDPEGFVEILRIAQPMRVGPRGEDQLRAEDFAEKWDVEIPA
jgi:hypothetical protein